MRDKPAEPRKEGANPEQRKQSSSLVSFVELRTTCVGIQVDRHRNHKGCPSLSSRNTTTEIGQAVVPVVYSRVDWKVAEALARPVSRGVPLFPFAFFLYRAWLVRVQFSFGSRIRAATFLSLI